MPFRNLCKIMIIGEAWATQAAVDERKAGHDVFALPLLQIIPSQTGRKGIGFFMSHPLKGIARLSAAMHAAMHIENCL